MTSQPQQKVTAKVYGKEYRRMIIQKVDFQGIHAVEINNPHNRWLLHEGDFDL
jgi:hypothetical protein